MTSTKTNPCFSGFERCVPAHTGSLTKALHSFVTGHGTLGRPRLTFHRGRAQRIYPSEYRKPWGVKYNRLIRLTRRLHG